MTGTANPLRCASSQPGRLQRGQSTLARTDIARQADTLATEGHVQIYACELGQGRAGCAFVNTFVAGSAPVGHENFGSDWPSSPERAAFISAEHRDSTGSG